MERIRVRVQSKKRVNTPRVITRTEFKREHRPSITDRTPVVTGDRLLRLVGAETIDDIRKRIAEQEAISIAPPPPPPPPRENITLAMRAAESAREKQIRKQAQLEERMRARELERMREKWVDKLTKPQQELSMTVSLYKSMASGAFEVVVQTNAQSLDVFIAALSDALHAALVHEASTPNAPDQSQALIAATLKNAFPVAFAIAGYKAEKVSESKLLTCGFASPDASELLAQSKQ